MSERPSPEPPVASADRAPRDRRTTGGEARRRYLDAAAELAAREGTGPDESAYAVSRVGMADVAADLGVARTTLYRLWPSKLDFWADLAAYLAATEPGPTAAEIGASIADQSTARQAIGAARVALNALQAAHLASPWVALRTALHGYTASPRLNALVAAANDRELDAITAQVEHTLAAADLAPRAPLTTRDIAVTAFCVADGLATGGRLSPRLTTLDLADEGSGGWGMLAFSMLGIVRRCTRPRTAADDPSDVSGVDVVSDGVADLTGQPTPDPAERWSAMQRAALAAGARRFADRVPSGAARGAPGPLGQISFARLARHAGVSRQALQRVWPSQQAFAADLATDLFEQRCEQVLALVREANRRSLTDPPGGPLVAAETAFGRLLGDAARRPLAHLTAASHEDDPAIRERCRVALESMVDRYSDDLATTSRAWGGSPRAGVALVHVASILVLTELAAARLERTNPGSVRVGLAHRGGRWSAPAVLMDGIVGHALDLPPGDDADQQAQ